MNRFDILEAVETDVKGQFDTNVQKNGDVELSWTDIEDQIHEAANQAIDNRLTPSTYGVVAGCPNLPPGCLRL